MSEAPAPVSSLEIRSRILRAFRRDLIGPGPEDADIAHERLSESPSRWYLTGFLAPKDDPASLDGTVPETDPGSQDEAELDVEEPEGEGAGGAAGDATPPDVANTRRRFRPTSIGLTVLLDPAVREIEARICWGDYRTEPPVEEALLLPEPLEAPEGKEKPKRAVRPSVQWVRKPQDRVVTVPVVEGRGGPILVPDSAAEQRRGGALVLETHSRVFSFKTPDGRTERVRALTVFLVNRRAEIHRFYADVSCIFQARLELVAAGGFRPRRDLSGYESADWDLRLADLHYRDLAEWAVGRNAAAAWDAAEEVEGRVTRVWTDPLPTAEVERVAPNEDPSLRSEVTFGMEALARIADGEGTALAEALAGLPKLFGLWIEAEKRKLASLEGLRRRETGERLIAEMEKAGAVSRRALPSSPEISTPDTPSIS
jgi:hypothetical protein